MSIEDTGNVEASAPATDDLRASLEAQFTAAEAVPETAPAVEEPPKDDRPRDEQGRFAPKKADDAPAPAKAADAAPAETSSTAPDKPDEQPAQASTPAVGPPPSWAADAKATWAELSPAVQQAVLKREREVSDGFRQKSEEIKRYDELLTPLRSAAQARGVDPGEGLKRLIAAQDYLDRDPVGALSWLAQSYGVDPSVLVNRAAQPARPPVQQPQPQVDPTHLVRQELQLYEAQRDVQEFRANAPHFAAVENEMSALLPGILQENPDWSRKQILQEAYDRATRANPVVWQSLQADMEAKQKAQREAEANRAQTEKAKKAAVSVRGAPGLPAGVAAGSKGSVRDDLMAAFEGNR